MSHGIDPGEMTDTVVAERIREAVRSGTTVANVKERLETRFPSAELIEVEEAAEGFYIKLELEGRTFEVVES